MIKKNYTIVTTESQLNQAIEHINKYTYLAFDTETTGLNVRKDEVIGFSFCGCSGEAFYVPIKTWNITTSSLVTVWDTSIISSILHLLSTKELLMWNGSFDVRITKNSLGIDLLPALFADIMLMKHTLEEDGFFGLKTTAAENQEELGLDAEKDANEEQIALKENIKKNGGLTTKACYEMYKADLEVMGVYANADADLTFRLAELYRTKLEKEGLEKFFYDDEVMPLYKEVTIPMEESGIKLDLNLIEQTKEEISKDIITLEKDIVNKLWEDTVVHKWHEDNLHTKFPPKKTGKFGQKVAELYFPDIPKTKSGKFSLTAKNITNTCRPCKNSGFLLGNGELDEHVIHEVQEALFIDSGKQKINISSKKQVGEIVFKYLSIKPLSTTDKGNPQFDDAMIQHLYTEHKLEWAKLLGDYNKLNKIKSAYVDRFLDNHEDGYYYFSYKQHGTISGRYSSDAQQLSRPKEEGELSPLVLDYNNRIRAFFIADNDRLFIDADYESLEPHCVDKYSIVQTVRGMLYIKDVVKDDLILTVDGYSRVLKKWDSNKKTIDLITRKGVLKCSPEHKVYLKDRGWVQASNVIKGDVIQELKIGSNLNEENTPILPIHLKGHTEQFAKRELTLDDAWLLGAFLGDGVCYTKSSGYIGICGLKKDNVTTTFKDIITKWGTSPKNYKDSRTIGMESYRIYDAWLISIFKNTFKVVGDEGRLLRVPLYILNANKQFKLSFFAGLVDTDGTYNNKKSELSVSTKSSDFASDICTLGNSLGLDGRIGVSYKKLGEKVHTMYNVRFTSISINKLVGYNFKDYLVCERKKPTEIRRVGKINSPDATVLEVLEHCNRDMVDITVENNHEFICNNLRVHNCFAHVSTDEGLRDIFRKGHDFYSTIAIKAENLIEYSPDKKADNYLGKLNKPLRQRAKAYALGCAYGMKEYALGKTLDIPTEEAKVVIDGYLNGFPNLKKWMEDSNKQARYNGYVKSKAGRVRHLPKVKEYYNKFKDKLLNFRFRKSIEKKYGASEVLSMYLDYKNGLNNAKNFQIQSMSASIVNKAALAVNRRFMELGIDGKVVANIHDQLIFDVPKNNIEECVSIVQDCMENTTKLSIELKAPPEVTKNWKDGH